MLLGDARTGKLTDNVVGFGRALRRAGVPVDAARIAWGVQALQAVGMDHRQDWHAALQAVMISREQDRQVFSELFDAYFRNPDVANKLLAQMLPTAEGKAEPSKRRPRVREALAPQKNLDQTTKKPQQADDKIEFDAAMTVSDVQRLRHADFNALSASEYRLVERLARQLPMAMPVIPSRRSRQGQRGQTLHWGGVMRAARRHGGECLQLPKRQKRPQILPLLILVDVSGSMERYSRLLLSFLHAATRAQKHRQVFAFGTHLTPLTPAFRLGDTDAMLHMASHLIQDYAGGTRLGASLSDLLQHHSRGLVGRRTVVLLITDGLDTGQPEDLAQALQALKRRCRSLLWLNPLMRYDQYQPSAQGAAVLHRHADHMVAIHNLTRLQELAQSLKGLITWTCKASAP